jgi:carbon-monoxide dehydrogenase medium subunit
MAEATYHEPDTLDKALTLLGSVEGARCLAGGQTLVAMMNARLVDPPALIGLRRVKELAGIARQADGALRIGATATHEAVAAHPEVRSGFPLIAETAQAIAHPPIRAFGTIGGAVAHGDPASDYPAALVAADATIEIAAAKGRRVAKAADFFEDFLTTALAPGEIVTAVIVPRPPAGARGGYLKYARVDGDYATLSVAAILALDGGTCGHVAAALGAAGPRPVRDVAAEKAWIGRPWGAEAAAALGKALAEAADPVDDVRGSSAYRRALIPGLVARALNALRS